MKNLLFIAILAAFFMSQAGCANKTVQYSPTECVIKFARAVEDEDGKKLMSLMTEKAIRDAAKEIRASKSILKDAGIKTTDLKKGSDAAIVEKVVIRLIRALKLEVKAAGNDLKFDIDVIGETITGGAAAVTYKRKWLGVQGAEELALLIKEDGVWKFSAMPPLLAEEIAEEAKEQSPANNGNEEDEAAPDDAGKDDEAAPEDAPDENAPDEEGGEGGE
jgi:hypothetical protein